MTVPAPEVVDLNRMDTLQRVLDVQYPTATKTEREANRKWWLLHAADAETERDRAWFNLMADAWTGPTAQLQGRLF